MLGALSTLIPVLLTDAGRGAAGMVLGSLLVFAAAVFLARRVGPPALVSLWLLAGAVLAEAVTQIGHGGFAIFAGTWAPAFSILLVTVPAVLAGAAVGICLSQPGSSKILPLVAWLAGWACALLLGYSFIGAGAAMLVAACALAFLQPRHALLLGCLLAGSAAMLAVLIFFSRAGGPGNMWPVVLPVQAIVLTPMVAAGCALGVAIARATHHATA